MVVRKPYRFYVDPAFFQDGNLAAAASSKSAEQEVMDNGGPYLDAGLVISKLVDQITDERWKASLQMTIMERLTYERAAELLSEEMGRKLDRKQVWRWAQKGLEQMQSWLEDLSWVTELSPKIPVSHKKFDVELVSLEEIFSKEKQETCLEKEETGDE